MRVTISKLVVASASILTIIAMATISFFNWSSSVDAIYQLNKSSYMQSSHALGEQLATPVRFKKVANIKEKIEVALQSQNGSLSAIQIYLPDLSLLYSSNEVTESALSGILQDKTVLVDQTNRHQIGVPM